MRYMLFFFIIFPISVFAENHVYVANPPKNSMIIQVKYPKSFFEILPRVKERLNNSTIATAVSVFSGAGLNLTKTTLRLFVFSPG
ncbi:hypothetical protein, partial [Microbulbifer sp. TYP-18]|uniref:hypothetical protein n=1 Tax=Microbulbifer sp. TYP-18 TaxID=3230024 RepID=UPI0034C604C1